MGLVVRRAGDAEYTPTVKMLVVGQPGAGKTRFASTAPNVFYANAEGGLMSVVDRQVPFVDIQSSDDLRLLRSTLSQSPEYREKMLGVPVETVVIDTLDEIQRVLVRERLAEGKKDNLTLADFGWLGDQVRAIVRAFRNLDLNVIVNVHSKSTEDAELGRTYEKPALQGAVADELPQYFDIVAVLRAQPVTRIEDGETKKELVRLMQTHPDPQHQWLKDRSGKLPPEFEVTFDGDFAAIQKLIYANAVPVSQQTGELTEAEVLASAAIVRETEPVKTPKREPRKGQQHLKLGEHPGQAEPSNLGQEETLPETPLLPEEPPSLPEQPEQPAPEPEPLEPEATAPAACEECGVALSDDEFDISKLRMRRALCHEHFVAAKTGKKGTDK